MEKRRIHFLQFLRSFPTGTLHSKSRAFRFFRGHDNCECLSRGVWYLGQAALRSSLCEAFASSRYDSGLVLRSV